MADFDAIRARLPHLGFAVYALQPGDPVTLEVLADGQAFTLTRPTLAAALARAFPEPAPTEEPQPDVAAEQKPNVFD